MPGGLTPLGHELAVKAAKARRGEGSRGASGNHDGGARNIPKAVQNVFGQLQSFPGNWSIGDGPAGYIISCNGIGVCMIPSSFKVLTAGALSTGINLRAEETGKAMREPATVAREIAELIPPMALLINDLNEVSGNTWIVRDGRYLENNERIVFAFRGNDIMSASEDRVFATLDAQGLNAEQVAERLQVINIVYAAVNEASRSTRPWVTDIGESEITISHGRDPKPLFIIDAQTNVLNAEDRSSADLQLMTNSGGREFADPDDLALLLLEAVS